MDFPRLQIAILAAALLVFDVVALDLTSRVTYSLIVVVALCLFWQLTWVLPYTILWRKEVLNSTQDEPVRQLSIITSNVLLVKNRFHF